VEVLKVDEWLNNQNKRQFFCTISRRMAIRIKDQERFYVDQNVTTHRENYIDSGYIVAFDKDNIHVLIRPDVWSSAIKFIPINDL